MTRFKFFGFLLPLAIAAGLVVGLGAAPAQAHCKGKHLDGETCTHAVDDGQGQRQQTFMVELIEGGDETVDEWIITGDNCKGWSVRKRVTDANFPPDGFEGCTGEDAITLKTNPPLHLCQININHADRPDMSLTMFFAAGQGVVGGVLCAGPVYKGVFDAKFNDCPDATCVTMKQPGPIPLLKLLQPDKGIVAGEVSVGTIVWTPLP